MVAVRGARFERGNQVNPMQTPTGARWGLRGVTAGFSLQPCGLFIGSGRRVPSTLLFSSRAEVVLEGGQGSTERCGLGSMSGIFVAFTKSAGVPRIYVSLGDRMGFTRFLDIAVD